MRPLSNDITAAFRSGCVQNTRSSIDEINKIYLPNKKMASKWLICTERKNGLIRENENSRSFRSFRGNGEGYEYCKNANVPLNLTRPQSSLCSTRQRAKLKNRDVLLRSLSRFHTSPV